MEVREYLNVSKKAVAATAKELSNAANKGKTEVATIGEFLESASIIDDNRLLCLGR